MSHTFWDPNPGSAFLDGSAAVGTTAADRPTNTRATAGVSNSLICDRTGFKIRVSEGLRDEWDGLKVRDRSWEPRHPLDFLRSDTREEGRGSPRPEPADVFIDRADYYVRTLDNDDQRTLGSGEQRTIIQ